MQSRPCDTNDDTVMDDDDIVMIQTDSDFDIKLC